MGEIGAQLIGLAGTAVAIASFQFKKNQIFFAMQALAAVCFSVHFFLLGATAGMALNVYCIFRGWLMLERDRGRAWARSRWAKIALYALCPIAVAITWTGDWRAVLSTVGSLIGTYAMYCGVPRRSRILQVSLVSPCWLIYNLLCHSVAGVLTESFNMVSSAVFLIRLRRSGAQTAPKANP